MDKLVIAGSRESRPTIDQISALIATLPDLVICGCADGVDKAVFQWARAHKISVEFFPAWMKQKVWALSVALKGETIHPLPRIQNRGAGNIRNGEMAFHATRALILMHAEGGTPGSINMRDQCLRKGFTPEVYYV